MYSLRNLCHHQINWLHGIWWLPKNSKLANKTNRLRNTQKYDVDWIFYSYSCKWTKVNSIIKRNAEFLNCSIGFHSKNNKFLFFNENETCSLHNNGLEDYIHQVFIMICLFIFLNLQSNISGNTEKHTIQHF